MLPELVRKNHHLSDLSLSAAMIPHVQVRKVPFQGRWQDWVVGFGNVWKCLESPVIWHSRVAWNRHVLVWVLFKSLDLVLDRKNTWQPLDLCNIWCLCVIMNHKFCLLTGLGRETQEFSQGEHPQGETLQLKVSWIGGTSKSSNNIQYTLVTYGGKSRFNMF